ncbi:MAG: adenylyltransferase/cytidyltransferase family protein [Clostridia bacterium]|nr:adenylyltransferase/cytidyltransferase family protein [Clostridia bacterium]
MKALILNSGLGRRMGVLTSEHPKCMTEVSSKDTILSRQLKMIKEAGIRDVVMTTGLFDDVLVNYCRSLDLGLNYEFVKNPIYDRTNYIYSMYCARESLVGDDILLMHGDLVFENTVLDAVLESSDSCMTVSTTLPLPEKDFKAVLADGHIACVGIEFFNSAVAAQPLYKILEKDFRIWLDKIVEYCENGQVKCYAENAFNEVSNACRILPLDVKNALCNEIDTPEDLAVITAKVYEVDNRRVYMCFAADLIHSGHVSIIKKASRLGRLTVGVLSDDAVAEYKRRPILPVDERKILFESIVGVSDVIVQNTLSYREVLETLRPDYVVHGDDWREGVQKPVRDEVVSILASYGGILVEFPYTKKELFSKLEEKLN